MEKILYFSLTAILLSSCNENQFNSRTAEQNIKVAKNCVDPDLKTLSSTQEITLCNGKLTKGQLDLSNLTPENIVTGVSIAGIEGNVVPSPVNCASEGATECVVKPNSPIVAINSNNIDSTKIERGTSIGGVVGTKLTIKQCRNAADLTAGDDAAISNLDRNHTLGSGPVIPATDIINIGFNHGMTTGFPVKITTAGGMPGGLTSGVTYYAIIASNTTIKLATSLANADSGIAVDITSTGTGNHYINSASNGVADVWDTIDDDNNPLSTSPGNSPWGADYICNETNFTNVSGSTSSLTPSGTTPAGATSSFSQIWEDNLTGLYFSNLLYNGSGSLNWASGFRMCAALNSGDGTGQWRIPTQKELMQFYVNGIGKLQVAGGTWNNQFVWSSTIMSGFPLAVYTVQLNFGYVFDGNRNLSTYGVICVR